MKQSVLLTGAGQWLAPAVCQYQPTGRTGAWLSCEGLLWCSTGRSVSQLCLLLHSARVGHNLTISLMLYRSSWRSLWKCVCIETLMLIGKSSTRRQPCSLMVYKHLMHTHEHNNTTSSSLVLVLASSWKMTANLSPCIGMRVSKW